MWHQEAQSEETRQYEALGFELVKIGVPEQEAVGLAAQAAGHADNMAIFGLLVFHGLSPHTARSVMAAAGFVNEKPS